MMDQKNFASGVRDLYDDLEKRKEWWSIVADGRCLDAAGDMKILANMAEMDIPIQHIGLVTSQKFVAANSDLNRRIVKSFLEGIHLMRTNPELAKSPEQLHAEHRSQ
jgi:hypothetical protein